MKRCPTCQDTFTDETLNFCRHDGTSLVDVTSSENYTKLMDQASHESDAPQTQPFYSEESVGGALSTARSFSRTADRRPVTRYAQSGDVNIAYQVVGSGQIDLVYVMGWVSNLDYIWGEPSYARFLNRLASFSRLILFDKRGTGLSDRVHESELPTLEQRMDDVRAVMDAVGSDRAALFGVSEGGPMSALFAATYPERTSALIMYGTYAKRIWDPEYPWAPTPEERQKWYDLIKQGWGGEVDLCTMAPSVATDE